jgi:hypothetical protein
MFRIHWRDSATGSTGCSEKPMTLEMANHLNAKYKHIHHWAEELKGTVPAKTQ